MTARRGLTAGLGICVAVLVAASVAWACTPQAGISLSPRSGEAGTRTVVSGERFAEGPVEVRWSGGGGALATANGPSFSVGITVPANASGGTYYVTAVQGEDSAVASFVVTSARTEEPQPAPAEPAPAPSPGGQDSAPAATPAPAAAAAPAAAPTPPTRGTSRRDTRQVALSRRAKTVPAARQATAPAAAAPAVPAPADVGAEAAPAPVALPSPRSVSTDVWGGFASGDLQLVEGPSLVGAQPGGQRGDPATLGMALLAVGMATLFGSAFAAVRQRRRAPVDQTP